jgi:DNA-binding NtrC family response regulator
MSRTHEILVVDDDALVNEFFEAVLKKLGYSVTTLASGEEGLQLLREREFDIVLSDVKMPRMSGIDLLKQAKFESPETVVIMITAYGTVKDAVEAMKLGAFDYILKPILPDELEMIVAKALEHRQLILENRILRSEIRGRYQFENIVGADKKLLSMLETLSSAAKSRATILIRGESGTGKELIARAIHYNSPRAHGPFITLNCAALPEGLIESELFGHEKGAFTNAIKQSQGRFELADGGTLLLDEISEMPFGVQAKLLRVIQEREFQRVGSGVSVKVDVRLVATTNKNLEDEVKAGRFRDDLYYRLNVIPLYLPPLRERLIDIPALVDHFVRKYNDENHRDIKGITEKAMRLLLAYHWPGNIRELENYIERAVVLCKGDRITDSDFPSHLVLGRLGSLSTTSGDKEMTISEMEKVMIIETLERHSGNRTKASEALGISSRTLRNKLHEYGMMEPSESQAGGDDDSLEQ